MGMKRPKPIGSATPAGGRTPTGSTAMKKRRCPFGHWMFLIAKSVYACEACEASFPAHKNGAYLSAEDNVWRGRCDCGG